MRKQKATGDDFLKGLDFDSWAKLVSGFNDTLDSVVVSSAKRAVAELHVTDHGFFDLVQKDALAWAKDRAAELIGKQWKDGKLVNDPEAKWSITDSTREGLRDLVVKAYEDGLDVTQLSDKIQDSYMFSESRADMIARTELARADSATTLTAWKESGVVEGKAWLLGSEHDVDCECDDNAEDGAIALDDTFSSGDDAPPAHPNCVCALVTNFLVDDGIIEDASDGEEASE
jgi:SPP1 gp7 family putative phage head morphogenesis protein